MYLNLCSKAKPSAWLSSRILKQYFKHHMAEKNILSTKFCFSILQLVIVWWNIWSCSVITDVNRIFRVVVMRLYVKTFTHRTMLGSIKFNGDRIWNDKHVLFKLLLISNVSHILWCGVLSDKDKAHFCIKSVFKQK